MNSNFKLKNLQVGGKEKEPKTVKFKFGVSKLSKKLKKLDLH